MDRTERELVEMMECAKRHEIFAEHAAFLERAYRIERQRTKRLRERNAHLERSREDMRIQRDRAHKKHKGAVRHAFQCDEGLEKDNERLRAELEAARDKAYEMRDKAHRYDAEMAAGIDPFEWEEGERVTIKAGTLAGATGTVRIVFGASVGVELDANAGRVLCYARDDIEAAPTDTPKGGA